MQKTELQKIVGNYQIIASKIVREWNGHLEMFSVPQAIENSREFLLLRTDILQKTVVVCSFNISMKVLDRVFNEVIVKARHNITIEQSGEVVTSRCHSNKISG